MLRLAKLQRSVVQGFIRQENRDIVIVRDDTVQLLDALQSYTAPPSLLERLKAEHASTQTGTTG